MRGNYLDQFDIRIIFEKLSTVTHKVAMPPNGGRNGETKKNTS